MKNIAILAFSDSYRAAPFDDPDWEIWGCNHLYPYIPRWDRWFEIHTEAYMESAERPAKFWPEYKAWLTAQAPKIPVYVNGDAGPKIEGARPYPLADMIEVFGRYFTSSVSYMMALAITEIADARLAQADPRGAKIGLWGVDMTHDTEWGWQRACMEHLIGVAVGQRIEVLIPETSALLRCPYLYGFEEEPGIFAEIEAAVAESDKEAKAKHEAAIIKAATMDGFRQGLAWTARRAREAKRGAKF